MRAVISVLAMLYTLGLFGCTVQINESDLFHPARDTMPGDHIGCTPVEIRVGSVARLRGWALESPRYTRWVIYCYGNAETATPMLSMLQWLQANTESNVLVVDYRGYGLSDGTPSLAALHHDAPMVYDYLRERWETAPESIFVMGRSLGTGVALSIASQREVAGLVLVSPPTSVADVVPAWRERFPWFLRWAVSEVRADSAVAAFRPQPVEMVAGVHAPLLIVHGTIDGVVPFRCGKTMIERSGAFRKKLLVIDGGDHDDLVYREARALADVRDLLNGRPFEQQ